MCAFYCFLKYNLLMWWKNYIFSIITPGFSVTWSFRNHYNMPICCSINISYYYQCLKHLCCLIFVQFFSEIHFKIIKEQHLLETEIVCGHFWSIWCIISKQIIDFFQNHVLYWPRVLNGGAYQTNTFLFCFLLLTGLYPEDWVCVSRSWWMTGPAECAPILH